MFSQFNTVHECDGQTDGQINGCVVAALLQCVAYSKSVGFIV